MAFVRVVDIIGRVEAVLQDSGIRWPRTELQDWINEAYTVIVSLRPDASSKTATYTCEKGIRQSITDQFPEALRLLDVVRNVSAASNYRIVRLTARSSLDNQIPEWPSEKDADAVQFFMYDPKLPREFLVYPPAKASVQLEVVYSYPPLAHTLNEADLSPSALTADTINLDDVYATPIVDWVLYRAYSKDADYAANEGRAAAFYTAFSTAVGAKNSTDAAAQPR